MNSSDKSHASPRLPPWLRRRLPAGGHSQEVRALLKELGLATVCTSAHCPNIGECFARRTATFMILGDRCTRNCSFCAVCSAPPLAVRDDEPDAVAEACARLELKHAVITSVTRDDLPDGGAAHFARVCHTIRARLPRIVIEILTPDFKGAPAAIETALAGEPDIFNHNLETVARLYPEVRPQADYARSLFVLNHAASTVRGQGAKGQGSGVRGQGSGDRRQELEAKVKAAEVREQREEAGGQGSGARGRGSGTGNAAKGQSSIVNRQSSIASSESSIVNRQSSIHNPSRRFFTKSGLMVGLGETREELAAAMNDLRGVRCEILTIGQYLAPSPEHHPVVKFYEPAEFEEMEAEARTLGFRAVFAGPFVRSSYQADRVLSDVK
ncbi:MAG: lipoyl synthase [Candidatus Sumerlaeota bacterium]|nr:lipoyl synthase [Candidatus Sumerlaeota bacterium]